MNECLDFALQGAELDAKVMEAMAAALAAMEQAVELEVRQSKAAEAAPTLNSAIKSRYNNVQSMFMYDVQAMADTVQATTAEVTAAVADTAVELEVVGTGQATTAEGTEEVGTQAGLEGTEEVGIQAGLEDTAEVADTVELAIKILEATAAWAWVDTEEVGTKALVGTADTTAE